MAGKKKSQSGPRYGFHGDKAGICYRTEVGAKIRAPKREGILIVTDRAGFYWRLDKSRLYDDEKVVAIRKEGKWISPTKTKPWTKNNRNKWTWNEDPEFEVRVYNADGFYGAGLWHGEGDFVSLCAHRLRRDVIEEVLAFIVEWEGRDIVQVFKDMYLNEYGRPFEMEAL